MKGRKYILISLVVVLIVIVSAVVTVYGFFEIGKEEASKIALAFLAVLFLMRHIGVLIGLYNLKDEDKTK